MAAWSGGAGPRSPGRLRQVRKSNPMSFFDPIFGTKIEEAVFFVLEAKNYRRSGPEELVPGRPVASAAFARGEVMSIPSASSYHTVSFQNLTYEYKYSICDL